MPLQVRLSVVPPELNSLKRNLRLTDKEFIDIRASFSRLAARAVERALIRNFKQTISTRGQTGALRSRIGVKSRANISTVGLVKGRKLRYEEAVIFGSRGPYNVSRGKKGGLVDKLTSYLGRKHGLSRRDARRAAWIVGSAIAGFPVKGRVFRRRGRRVHGTDPHNFWNKVILPNATFRSIDRTFAPPTNDAIKAILQRRIDKIRRNVEAGLPPTKGIARRVRQ